MSLRFRLACAFLMAGGVSALPASAQNRNYQNQNQNQSPVAQASKSLNDAHVKLRQAQLEVQKIRDKEKAELMKKPEWLPVAAELKKAEEAVAAAKRAATNTAHTKPDYVAAEKERENADKVRQQAGAPIPPGSDATPVSDADLATANNSYITASMRMKAIEKQIMTDDQALGDANAKLDAAKAKMAQLDAEVDEALKNDQSFQQLQQGVVQAQQQVDQAQQQLTQARQQLAQQAQQRASQPRPSYNNGSNR
jgi:multidrug resistance efflux pump